MSLNKKAAPWKRYHSHDAALLGCRLRDYSIGGFGCQRPAGMLSSWIHTRSVRSWQFLRSP